MAKKLLPLVESKDIKLMYCPQLNNPDNLGTFLNLIKHGNISEIIELCKVYGIIIPANTRRDAIKGLILPVLSKENIKDSKYLLEKFDLGTSGGWKAFTK